VHTKDALSMLIVRPLLYMGVDGSVIAYLLLLHQMTQSLKYALQSCVVEGHMPGMHAYMQGGACMHDNACRVVMHAA
jgi:hypothetical protein